MRDLLFSRLAFTALCLAAATAASRPARAAEARLDGPSPKSGWETWTATEGERNVTVHVARDPRRLPLVVFAAGSHCLPVFFTSKDGRGLRDHSTLPFEVDAAQKLTPFHFAVVERKHLQSFVTFESKDAARATDHCTEEHGGVRKEDRAADLALAARALGGEPWVSGVLLAGHSEGADVATGALRLVGAENVVAIGFFSSGGVSQFFDPVAVARRAGDAARAQRAFDELLAMTGPEPPADYEGFPRARFESFAIASTPLDDLVGTRTPVFVAQGTADHNSAPEAADAMVVELLRKDAARAVRYLVLDGVDHGFNDGEGHGHAEEVLAEFVRWSTSGALGRSVETRAFAKVTPSGSDSTHGTSRVRFIGLPPWALVALLAGAAVVPARKALGAPTRGLRAATSAIALTLLAAAGAVAALWYAIAVMGAH